MAVTSIPAPVAYAAPKTTVKSVQRTAKPKINKSGSLYKELTKNGLFDYEYYKANNPDVVAAQTAGITVHKPGKTDEVVTFAGTQPQAAAPSVAASKPQPAPAVTQTPEKKENPSPQVTEQPETPSEEDEGDEVNNPSEESKN